MPRVREHGDHPGHKTEKLTSYIAHDHRYLDDLLEAVDDLVSERRLEAAARPLAEFHLALTRHLEFEEQVVYSLFERLGEREAELVKTLRVEHVVIQGLVAELSDALRDGLLGVFSRVFDTLMDLLNAHDRVEEDEIYPRLENALAALTSVA